MQFLLIMAFYIEGYCEEVFKFVKFIKYPDWHPCKTPFTSELFCAFTCCSYILAVSIFNLYSERGVQLKKNTKPNA